MLITSPALAHLPHGFTTRQGGVSVGERASLDLALREGADDVVENWRRALAPISRAPADLALVNQVHGAEVLVAEQPSGPFAVIGSADALVTRTAGIVLAIRTADCVPVLFAAPGAVGAAHAGWRGVAAGVVVRTVERLCAIAACAPGQVIAVIGPHISAPAYEVGAEVIEGIAASVPRRVFERVSPTGRSHADLRAAVAHQLRAAGVDGIAHVERCTSLDAAFFSHRRDGAGTGRQASVIALPGPT